MGYIGLFGFCRFFFRRVVLRNGKLINYLIYTFKCYKIMYRYCNFINIVILIIFMGNIEMYISIKC